MQFDQNSTILQVLLDIVIFIGLLMLRLRRNEIKGFYEMMAALVLLSLLWQLFKLSVGDSLYHVHPIVRLLIFLFLLLPAWLIRDVIITLTIIRANLRNPAYLLLIAMTIVTVISVIGIVIARSVLLVQVIFAGAFTTSLPVAWLYAKVLSERTTSYYRYRISEK